MKKLYYLLFTILISCSQDFELKEGDFLFQDLDSSPLCNAIELVTPGYKNANLSHVGLVVLDNDTLKVLEAIPPKVILTKLDDFLNRSHDKNGNAKVIVGRLKRNFQNSIDDAILYSKSKLGKKYDDVFLLNNNSYYCSELIYESFEKDSIFLLKPMTFLHPATKDTLEIWKAYYSDLNTSIPEGKPGINPGIMSLSNNIEIIHYYGIPDGMKE